LIISSENRNFLLEAGLSKSTTFKRIQTKIAIQPGTLDYTNARSFFKREEILKIEESVLAAGGDGLHLLLSTKFAAALALFRRSKPFGITHKLIAALLGTEIVGALHFITDGQPRVQVHAADGIFYHAAGLTPPSRRFGIRSPGRASPKPFQQASEVPEKG
jgi:hypothetical protein